MPVNVTMEEPRTGIVSEAGKETNRDIIDASSVFPIVTTGCQSCRSSYRSCGPHRSCGHANEQDAIEGRYGHQFSVILATIRGYLHSYRFSDGTSSVHMFDTAVGY
jgi:hypothetical protein